MSILELAGQLLQKKRVETLILYVDQLGDNDNGFVVLSPLICKCHIISPVVIVSLML